MSLRKAAEMALNAMLDIPMAERPKAQVKAIQALRQALAQPEQKPVAWVYNGILHEFDPSEFATSEVKPLYTAPPKREWVGLTVREITKIGNLDWDSAYVGIWYDFAKAIEAKLKEKNSV